MAGRCFIGGSHWTSGLTGLDAGSQTCTRLSSRTRDAAGSLPGMLDAQTTPRAGGSPIDITDPESPDRVERQLRDAGTYIDFTWALALSGLPRHRTRLLVRTRANWAPSALGFLSTPLGLVDASYGVAMLRAIARRAESIDSVAPSPPRR